MGNWGIVREQKGPKHLVLKVQSNGEAELADPHADAAISADFRLGASCNRSGACEFLVWAPNAKRVDVRIPDENRLFELSPQPRGYFQAELAGLKPGTRYLYMLDGEKERADPASRYQPDGVFGPSQVLDLSDFEWSDEMWHGLELKDFILYELHVGTYTPAGTLDGLIEHISELKSLGITAIELMPLAQFSGTRNWGYDGVFPSRFRTAMAARTLCNDSSMPATAKVSRLCSMSFTTILVRKGIFSATLAHILPTDTERLGVKP